MYVARRPQPYPLEPGVLLNLPRRWQITELREAGALGQVTPAAVAQTGGAIAAGFTPQIALALGLSVPVVGAAIAGVTLAVTALLSRKSGRQKLAATEIVEDIEPLLRDNLASYEASERTRADQQAALENFDRLWNYVETACSDPALGSAGVRCINERKRGGSAPWCPTATGCDWFTLYRDPIANDPEVRSGFQAVTTKFTAGIAEQPAGRLGLMALGALALGAIL